MADRIDYLGGIETSRERTEAEYRAYDAKQGRFGIFEEINEGAQVTAWQVPKAGQTMGPSPAFLGPQWSVGPSPDGVGAVVLDKRTNQASFMPPGAWLIRYDGGEVVGIDGEAFAEAYAYLGEVGKEITPRREPVGKDVDPDPGAAPEPAEAEDALEQRSNGSGLASGEIGPGPTVAGEDYARDGALDVEKLQADAWRQGYAARVREEPLLREGREQAIRDDERAALNAMIIAQRGARSESLAIDRFVDVVVADNERLRKRAVQRTADLDRAVSIAEQWRHEIERTKWLLEPILAAMGRKREEWEDNLVRRADIEAWIATIPKPSMQETYDALAVAAERGVESIMGEHKLFEEPKTRFDEAIEEALVDKAAEPADDAEPKQEQ